MTVFADIAAALDTHLSTMTSLPPVAWENREYTPTNGTLYLRPTMLFGDTVQGTLGTSGTDINEGIYQIDVFAKSGDGKGAGIVMADLVATRFKRGTSLTYNSRTVTVISARRKPGNIDGNWYQIPVEIVYRSHTQPRN